MEGFIWYHQEFHGGTKQEYESYCKLHSDAHYVMTYYVSSTKELQEIAKNLNNSNVQKSVK